MRFFDKRSFNIFSLNGLFPQSHSHVCYIKDLLALEISKIQHQNSNHNCLFEMQISLENRPPIFLLQIYPILVQRLNLIIQIPQLPSTWMISSIYFHPTYNVLMLKFCNRYSLSYKVTRNFAKLTPKCQFLKFKQAIIVRVLMLKF